MSNGTSSEDYARALSLVARCNVYVAGYTAVALDGRTNAAGDDLFVAFGWAGEWQLTRQLGTSSDDSAKALSLDAERSWYIAAETDGPLDGQKDAGN
jgi:hypothetical protein